MFKSLKKELILIGFGVLLFVILMNFSMVIDLAGNIMNIFESIFIANTGPISTSSLMIRVIR